MTRPRLVLAEDHPQTALLLEQLLQPEFDVVEVVRDGRALVLAADRLSPDAIVTDITMPELDGITAAEVVLTRNPSIKVVLVTVNGDRLMIDRGLATGALGYVLKTSAGDDLIPALHAALRGECHVSKSLHYTPAM